MEYNLIKYSLVILLGIFLVGTISAITYTPTPITLQSGWNYFGAVFNETNVGSQTFDYNNLVFYNGTYYNLASGSDVVVEATMYYWNPVGGVFGNGAWEILGLDNDGSMDTNTNYTIFGLTDNIVLYYNNSGTLQNTGITLNNGANYFYMQITDRIIPIYTGSNLIGISNRSNISLDSVSFSEGANNYNYSDSWMYNLAGIHNNISYSWNYLDITISNATTTLNCSQAVSAGWFSGDCKTIFAYWNRTYCYIDEETMECVLSPRWQSVGLDNEGTMDSYTGYLISPLISGLRLNIPNTNPINLINGNNYFMADQVTQLQSKKAYWVSAYAGINMTLANVGGTQVGDSFPFAKVQFSNGTTNLTWIQASSAPYSWVAAVVWKYEYNPDIEERAFVSYARDSGESFYTYTGYGLQSNLNNIQMIFDEQQVPTPQPLCKNKKCKKGIRIGVGHNAQMEEDHEKNTVIQHKIIIGKAIGLKDNGDVIVLKGGVKLR